MKYKLPIIWLCIWFSAAMLTLFFFNNGSEHVLSRSFGKPTFHHLLGFDGFGRDLLNTILRASALSGLFAFFAVSLSCVLGLSFGTILALLPSKLRFYGIRILDFSLAFPSLLLALTIASVHGPGWGTLTIAMLLGTIPQFIRLIYVRSHELLTEEYVLAAKALGANPLRIITHHLTPSLISLCAIKTPNFFAHALLAEATLSFLGIGAPIGTDTWGSLLNQGKDYLIEAPRLAVTSGIPLILTVFSLQKLTETLSRRHLASRG